PWYASAHSRDTSRRWARAPRPPGSLLFPYPTLFRSPFPDGKGFPALGRERPIPKVKTGEAVSSGPEGLGAPRVFLERSETVTRSGVWLGVGGLVRRGDSVLAVKKRYGATKGLWTMPGGFVAPGETLDEAVVREIREETGVETAVCGVIAVRTGVLRTGVSDNLVLFSMKYLSGEPEPDGRE